MLRSHSLAHEVTLALFTVGAACGCSSSNKANTPTDGGDNPPTDSGAVDAPAGGDGGADGGGYTPGFKADVGQIVQNGGPVVKSPKIVTVTWNADPNQAALEAFGDALGGSSYWAAVVGEYGVGAAMSGAANHAHVSTAPPATQDNSALETWIGQQIQGAPGTGWPAADASTIYAIYVPTGMILSSPGPYHGELAVGANAHVPYVVIDENDTGGRPALDAATRNASHEIAETATNPHNFSDLGVVGFDGTHIAWQMMASDSEIGDVCETNPDADFKGGADLPYLLQRLWSNKSASAGHSPCVPASADSLRADETEGEGSGRGEHEPSNVALWLVNWAHQFMSGIVDTLTSAIALVGGQYDRSN